MKKEQNEKSSFFSLQIFDVFLDFPGDLRSGNDIYIYIYIYILLREAPFPLDCVSKVVVRVCVTDFGSIPLGLQRRGHATAYWCFDARIRFLLFLTKNGPV